MTSPIEEQSSFDAQKGKCFNSFNIRFQLPYDNPVSSNYDIFQLYRNGARQSGSDEESLYSTVHQIYLNVRNFTNYIPPGVQYPLADQITQ